MREKMDTSGEDLREIEKGVDSLAMAPPDEWSDREEITKPDPSQKPSVPAPVRSIVAIIETLPPNGRVLGLALILGALAFFAWRGWAL